MPGRNLARVTGGREDEQHQQNFTARISAAGAAGAEAGLGETPQWPCAGRDSLSASANARTTLSSRYIVLDLTVRA